MPQDHSLYDSPLFRIRGTLLASVKDRYGEVSVIDNRLYRILSFDRTFEQSKMQRSNPVLPVHNYIAGMLMAVALSQLQRVLVLGLGGGSLVRALYAANPAVAMEVVELREAVLQVAQRYFSLPSSEQIQYRIADAAEAIAQADEARYSLIFADLYSASAIVPLQSSAAFLQQCAAKLLPDGWLVLNQPHHPDKDPAFRASLTALFRHVLLYSAPSGNVVIYASNSPDTATLDQQRRAMRACGPRFYSDFSSHARHISYLHS